MRCQLLTILLFVSNLLSGQTIDSKKALEDLRLLKHSIEIYNPALSHYTPDFGAQADDLLQEIGSAELSAEEYFQFVSRLCALSNEGHFLMGSWSDTVHSGFLQNRFRYLPLSIKIASDGVIVWSDYSNEQQLKRGDRIIAINGLAMDSILNAIWICLPTDGRITTYADRNIELGFSWMYYLLVDQPDKFTFSIGTEEMSARSVTLSAINRDQQQDNYKRYCTIQAQTDEPESFYVLRFDGTTAYLKFPTFDRGEMEKYHIQPKKLYAELFREFREKHITNLVLDLRGNTGGRNEFADAMVPYILKHNHDVKLLKTTVSWSGKKKTYKLPKVSKWLFDGSIYVLVDGRTYSAGSTLARYLKEFGQATIIGEETGTRYEGFAAGSTQYVRLTNSGIRIGIPRYLIQFPPSTVQPTSNQGVLPDYPVKYTATDLLDQRDLHIMEAKRLIGM
ncbi:MAG: hypothetical protein GC178_14010 [Flavobacteriales bacterium]|nr:hypothetical protein [Flavobacteriales bacterium]